MSVEIRAGFPCPHLILEENTTLSDDRVSVPLRAPVAVASATRILVNDSHYVPSSGLYSQATLTGSYPGPYRIRRCDAVNGPQGNVLVITTSGSTVSVSLPIGDRVTLSQVIDTIRLSDSDVVATASPNGALELTDATSVGRESFVRVGRPNGDTNPGGAVDALGFTQRGARGATVYPAWDLITRQDVYPSPLQVGRVPVKARYPRFRTPLRGNPTIKASYVSFPERCPRCRGSLVENDYRFDRAGDVLLVDNTNLLYQACLKMILTRLGSNPYHPQYGSGIMGLIGRKRMGAAATLIREQVSTALSKVQNTQTQQRKYQTVTEQERLYTVNSVDVREVVDDPTAFTVDVVVSNAARTPIPISIAFSVPGAVALGGSTGRPLGAQPTNFGPAYREIIGD